MKTRNSHGLLQLRREALAYCQCASALISGNKALFVSVDLIGEKNQVILEYIIKTAWLKLGILTVLKIFIVLQTSEGGGGARSRSLPTLLLRAGGGVNVYFHKDFNCYICIDATAAEWHIPWFIRRSKQLFPLLYSQMLFYVICNYVCLLHRPVCNYVWYDVSKLYG